MAFRPNIAAAIITQLVSKINFDNLLIYVLWNNFHYPGNEVQLHYFLMFIFNFILAHTCKSDDTHHYCCRDLDNGCGEYEGNCNNNGECQDGLRCGNTKICKNEHGFPHNYNCCYNHTEGK